MIKGTIPEGKPEGPAYLYRAKVVSVYDGDTIKVDIDQGFGDWKHGQNLRLFGVNTPEIRGEERDSGLVVRDWVREQIPPGTDILVQTIRDKTGKYGRWLAIVWTGHEKSLNLRLLDGNMAREY